MPTNTTTPSNRASRVHPRPRPRRSGRPPRDRTARTAWRRRRNAPKSGSGRSRARRYPIRTARRARGPSARPATRKRPAAARSVRRRRTHRRPGARNRSHVVPGPRVPYLLFRGSQAGRPSGEAPRKPQPIRYLTGLPEPLEAWLNHIRNSSRCRCRHAAPCAVSVLLHSAVSKQAPDLACPGNAPLFFYKEFSSSSTLCERLAVLLEAPGVDRDPLAILVFQDQGIALVGVVGTCRDVGGVDRQLVGRLQLGIGRRIEFRAGDIIAAAQLPLDDPEMLVGVVLDFDRPAIAFFGLLDLAGSAIIVAHRLLCDHAAGKRVAAGEQVVVTGRIRRLVIEGLISLDVELDLVSGHVVILCRRTSPLHRIYHPCGACPVTDSKAGIIPARNRTREHLPDWPAGSSSFKNIDNFLPD